MEIITTADSCRKVEIDTTSFAIVSSNDVYLIEYDLVSVNGTDTVEGRVLFDGINKALTIRGEKSTWDYIVFPVNPGDEVSVYKNNTVSIVTKSWTFIDSANKIISAAPYNAGNGLQVAPEGSVKIIVNTRKVDHGLESSVVLKSHTSEGTWEGYYNNDPSYGVKGYGKLYTWDCICSGNETPSSAMAKLLKDGWRVPTKADFDTLYSNLGDTISNRLNSACEKWYWPVTEGITNSSGFSAIQSNFAIGGDSSFGTGSARIWASSKLDSEKSYYCFIDKINNTIASNYSSEFSRCYSIRLVRDVPATVATLASVDGTATIVNN